jgi:hypothetical protein
MMASAACGRVPAGGLMAPRAGAADADRRDEIPAGCRRLRAGEARQGAQDGLHRI